MKRGFGLLLVLLSILSLSSCKKSKAIFSEIHACTSEYLIRKGETVYANFDEMQMCYPVNSSVDKSLEGKKSGTSFEGKNLDKVILSSLFCSHSYVAITCETPFQEEVIITKVSLNWKDGSKIYSRIYSTDIHIKYSDATLEEPIFSTTNSINKNNGNFSTFYKKLESTFDYSVFTEFNYVTLFFGPKDSSIGSAYKDSYISINSIEAVSNDKVKITSMKHTMYIAADVMPYEDIKNYSFQNTSFPIVIDDKEYENQNEFLIMYIYFEDTIENKSVFTGLTLKINLTIDGMNYDIYRDISYNRVPTDYYENPNYDENMKPINA